MSETTQNCDAVTKTATKKCGREGVYGIKGKCFCPQHAKIELKVSSIDEIKKAAGVTFKGKPIEEVKVAEKKTPAKAAKSADSNATVEKKTPAKAAKSADSNATVEKKTPAKAAEKVSEKPQPTGTVVKPPSAHNGTCSGKTGKGEDCSKKASYTCDDECAYCEGAALCGTHWNSKHKAGGASSGKKAADGEECEHTVKKTGLKCGKKANGVGEDGLRGCGIHGVKKESASATPIIKFGPLGDVDLAELGYKLSSYLISVSMFVDDEKMEARKSGKTVEFLVAEWLNRLLFLASQQPFDQDELIEHLANADFFNSEDQDHQSRFGESFMKSVSNFLKSEPTWLFRLYEMHSTAEGVNGSKIKAILDEIISEFSFEVKKAKASTSSTKSASKLVSSVKNRVAKSILDMIDEEEKETPAEKPVEEEKKSVEEEKKSVEEEKEEAVVDDENVEVVYELPDDASQDEDQDDVQDGEEEATGMIEQEWSDDENQKDDGEVVDLDDLE